MFQGKTVWITGASSGFGEALAQEFSNQRAQLVLSGRNRQALERVGARLGASVQVCMDMNEPASFPAKTEEAIRAFGQIDIVVHNAAIAQNALATDTLPAVHRQIMEVDFFSHTELTRCLLPHFIDRQSGQIVVVSGLLAKVGLPGRSSYSAAKAALHGYFNSLRAELLNDNITISLLDPGAMQTPLASKALNGRGEIDGRTALNGCPVDEAARQALKAIADKRYEAYIGKKDKGWLMLTMSRLCPERAVSLMLRQLRHPAN